MNLRAAWVAAACSFPGLAAADAEHDRIAVERAAAEARFGVQKRECETRFVVAACLDAAQTERRATLGRLRERELGLDEAHRREAAAARRQAIAEKSDAAQARASDAPPEPPRVRVRRAAEPVAAPRPAAEHPPPAPRPVRVPHPARAADRSDDEQRNRAQYEARERAAQAHRDEVEQRNAQRASQGKVTAPLPPPPGAASAP